ncbi:hypothetical protein [Algoriphagus resistens]|uniref:hypothetical protein n=1 Tax=Algoriphagus resistens TaxID=1750590 RepID=UPI000716C568|nr:hypothetical protein [Algoriphagus resistens]
MKKSQILLPFLLSVHLFLSCKNQNTGEHENLTLLKKEVITVHDDAMAKMGNLMRLKKELNANKDTITDMEIMDRIVQSEAALSEANEEMMNWMRAFSENFPAGFLVAGMKHGTHSKEGGNGETDQGDLYKKLQEELTKIKEVDQQMNKAVENAELLLGVK